jgi:secondary thiamine-phosphate synthase enzyme
MMQQIEIVLPEFRRGFHLITRLIEQKLSHLPQTGLIHIFIKHTSAGLTLNENADPTVRSDFEKVFNRLVPENQSFYDHTLEGADDLPAHIKSSLVSQSLIIPITQGRLNLGTWQGIYLCEFRNYGGPRQLVITVMG